MDYQASIAQRTAAAPTGTLGAFRNGSTVGKTQTDFDQSYNPINSYEQGSGAGGYVVRKGDTLQGLAAGLYGDSSLWYKIAQVNGLSGQTALIEGQSLTLPAGVVRNTNNASTFQPYDPASTIGDTSSTAAAAPPKKKGCGAGGQQCASRSSNALRAVGCIPFLECTILSRGPRLVLIGQSFV